MASDHLVYLAPAENHAIIVATDCVEALLKKLKTQGNFIHNHIRHYYLGLDINSNSKSRAYHCK